MANLIGKHKKQLTIRTNRRISQGLSQNFGGCISSIHSILTRNILQAQKNLKEKAYDWTHAFQGRRLKIKLNDSRFLRYAF